MILINGLLLNDSSVVATLATVGNLFIGKIPKRPPNDVIYILDVFVFLHKTLSVIHVIRGFRGHRIRFWCYYVHLISTEPIF